MALAGHDTLYSVINSSATSGSYSGTLNGVVAGELVVVEITALPDSGGGDPSTWAVTLGSGTLTHVVSNTSSGVLAVAAIFAGVASGGGDLTLAISSSTCRSLEASARRITGFNTTTPVANSGGAKQHASDTTSLTSPNAVTTAADGNCIVGCIAVKGGTVTNLAVGSADGSATGQTGGTSTSDHEWGHAYDLTPTAASVTFAWTWTTANRSGAVWVEIAAATGGSIQADRVETAAATESQSATAVSAAAASEAATASEASTAALSTSAALAEAATASEASTAALSTSATLVEAASASEASTGGLLSSAAVAEGSVAADAAAAASIRMAAVQEAGGAADLGLAVLLAAAGTAEAAVANAGADAIVIPSAASAGFGAFPGRPRHGAILTAVRGGVIIGGRSV